MYDHFATIFSLSHPKPVCPDDSFIGDTTTDGNFDVSVVGENPDTDPGPALINEFNTTLELCGDNDLLFETLCPAGEAVIMAFRVDVLYVSLVKVTFVRVAPLEDVVEEVSGIVGIIIRGLWLAENYNIDVSFRDKAVMIKIEYVSLNTNTIFMLHALIQR